MHYVIQNVILGMDKQVEICNRLFQWDEAKDKLNQQKHGISFTTAANVFGDVNALEFYDQLHSSDEDRYIILGVVNKVLFVVYTERNDSIRIISARVATAKERVLYYGNS